MRSAIAWGLLAITFLAIALIAQLPAKLVYGYAAEQVKPLQLDGIEGTVWHGSAQRGQYGDLPLQKLKWDWRPVALLKAQMGFRVNGLADGARVEGNVATRTGSTLHLSDATAFWTLEDILRVSKPPAQLGSLKGQVIAKVDAAQFAADRIDQLEGRVVIANLQHGGLKDLVLGDYEFEAVMEDGAVVVNGKDLAGLVALQLGFKLSAKQDWQLAGSLSPKKDAPPQLRGILPLFGQRRSDGRFVLEWHGNITSGAAKRGLPPAG